MPFYGLVSNSNSSLFLSLLSTVNSKWVYIPWCTHVWLWELLLCRYDILKRKGYMNAYFLLTFLTRRLWILRVLWWNQTKVSIIIDLVPTNIDRNWFSFYQIFEGVNLKRSSLLRSKYDEICVIRVILNQLISNIFVFMKEWEVLGIIIL